MSKTKIRNINELNLTSKQREEHFFKVGYGYAILHLQLGLEEEKLVGLEKTLLKHLDFVEPDELKRIIKEKIKRIKKK